MLFSKIPTPLGGKLYFPGDITSQTSCHIFLKRSLKVEGVKQYSVKENKNIH